MAAAAAVAHSTNTTITTSEISLQDEILNQDPQSNQEYIHQSQSQFAKSIDKESKFMNELVNQIINNPNVRFQDPL